MKLGIIGSGKIVHDFLTTASKIKNLHLAAISTTKRSAQIGQALAKQYNIPHAYSDNQQLYADPTVDTVYVGVPNFLHYAVARRALENGKNVICEKPLVETIAQAKELAKLAHAKDRIMLEAITNIHLENYRHLKAELKKIAPIHIVSLNYTQYSSRYDNFLKGKVAPVFDPAKGGGALMDLNIYNIHLAVGLFGRPSQVQYYPNFQRGVDTSGILHLTYPDKQANLIASKDSSANSWSVIEGEKGSLSFTGSTGELNNFTLTLKRQDPQHYNYNHYPHRMAQEFVDFTHIIDTHDIQTAKQLFQHSLVVMQVLTAAKKSAAIKS